jgi:putative oxidoreductase
VDVFAGVLLLLGRILFTGLFAFSARGHIQNHPRYAAIARGKLPIAAIAGWPVGVYLLVAGVSIVVGIWPDIGALMVALFVLPAAVLFHQFWTFSDPAARRTQQSSFFRNVTLLGAALSLFALFASAGHLPFALTGPAIDLA